MVWVLGICGVSVSCFCVLGDLESRGGAAQESRGLGGPLNPKTPNPDTSNPKLTARSPKPETRNPKPETLNPKP